MNCQHQHQPAPALTRGALRELNSNLHEIVIPTARLGSFPASNLNRLGPADAGDIAGGCSSLETIVRNMCVQRIYVG